MKLNKTLTEMKNANAEGGAVTIYGQKAYNRILNFKDVVSVSVDSICFEIKLTDGSTITAFYSDAE